MCMQVRITETSSCFIKALRFCNFTHTKLSTASILCSTEFKLPYKLCQHKTFIQGKLDTNREKENGLKQRTRGKVTENVYEKCVSEERVK